MNMYLKIENPNLRTEFVFYCDKIQKNTLKAGAMVIAVSLMTFIIRFISGDRSDLMLFMQNCVVLLFILISILVMYYSPRSKNIMVVM